MLIQAEALIVVVGRLQSERCVSADHQISIRALPPTCLRAVAAGTTKMNAGRMKTIESNRRAVIVALENECRRSGRAALVRHLGFWHCVGVFTRRPGALTPERRCAPAARRQTTRALFIKPIGDAATVRPAINLRVCIRFTPSSRSFVAPRVSRISYVSRRWLNSPAPSRYRSPSIRTLTLSLAHSLSRSSLNAWRKKNWASKLRFGASSASAPRDGRATAPHQSSCSLN